MKIIVIGLGSMGQRRIRLLRELDPTIAITGVDSNTARAAEVAQRCGIDVAPDLQSLDLSAFDGAVVSTSPLSHCQIIRSLLPMPVFTELNLVDDGYDVFTQPCYQDKLFLSSTLRYRRDIRFIAQQVAGQKVNYIYHVGQYLPDWHPWESYQSYFVGNRRTNGCREIMAIDLPWIVDVFGDICSFRVEKDKMSDLKIDYNDNYLLMFQHESGAKGVVAVDVVARKAIRRLEVFSEKTHIFWDGAPDTLSVLNLETKKLDAVACYETVEQNGKYSANIIENAYRDELAAFLKMVRDHDTSEVRYSFAQDQEILHLIDKIEG